VNPASHVNGESRGCCRRTSGGEPDGTTVPDTAFVTIDIEHVSVESVVSTVGAAAGPCEGETPMVLVVEHDPWTRLVMCDVLAQGGFRVASASNGFSAVRLARREPLALVVLDLVLPEQSGLSVLAELKASPATARVPVLVINGHQQALRDAFTQADAVIAKPFGADTLRAEVRRSGRRTVKAAADRDSCHTCPEGDRPVGTRRGS
jgi:CheY-like chemotaxis protein